MSAGTTGRDFLLEIGTEEIPARMVDAALAELADRMRALIVRARLAPEGAAPIRTYGTPRRLAVLCPGLRAVQPDETVEVAGPPVKAAFDAAGRPTAAGTGFARAQGVEVGDLARLTTPRGECVGVRRTVPGRHAGLVLAQEVPGLVLGMPFPKTMRWGTGEISFVRPIHWVVALLDADLVDLAIAGVPAGRESRGHRLRGSGPVPLARAADYVEGLGAHLVMAEVGRRRGAIEERLGDAARAVGGRIASPPGRAGNGDPDLLGEVTHLVEWPAVITGGFDAAFLDLPAEVLITAMRHHQRYFALRGEDGALLDRFLAVIDGNDDRRGLIRKGNEWVLRARLGDARFFWEEDRRQGLEAHAAGLGRLTFHEKLGDYARKAERIGRLVEILAPSFEAAGSPPDRRAARDAARLCKADLCTQMVREFPELEGIVGGLYARADGLPPAVAGAVYAHYLPRGIDDPLPATPEGAMLSLADRLDTQVGIFLLGIVPTGSRDPYGLRRSVQGACRILVEKRVRLSLHAVIGAALEGYAVARTPDGAAPEEARAALLDFYAARQEHLAEQAGVRLDSVRAALRASADDPADARLRMEALEAIRADPAFMVLAAAHKRIQNILPGRSPSRVDPAALRDEAERTLHAQVERLRPEIERLQAAGDHLGALRQIARLAAPVDRFFNEVMVMAEDRTLRDNRLALLNAIANLFLRVGDFAAIVVEGAPAGAGSSRGGT